METLEILKKNNFNRNPNSTTILFPGYDSLPIGTTWSCKKEMDVIPTEYGFKLFREHGFLCPPTEIQFPRYATEESFLPAFNRMTTYLNEHVKSTEALGAYIWGD